MRALRVDNPDQWPQVEREMEGAVLATVGCGGIVVARMVEPIVASFEPAFVGLYAILSVTILLVPIPVEHVEYVN